MKQTLIILRGAPACGKSSIAKALRNYDRKIAWLKVDNFKPFFAKDASDALEYVNGSAIITLKYLLLKGFSVVMEGVLQDSSIVDKAIEIAHDRNIKAYAFELQCYLHKLMERDKNRLEVKLGCRESMNRTVIKKIQNTLLNNPCIAAKTINVENKSLNECIESIQKLIE